MNAQVHPIKTSAELSLAETFAAAEGGLPGTSQVKATRAAAFQRFLSAGLPHRRVEAWHYTDLRALMRDAKPLAAPPSAAAKAKAKAGEDLLPGSGARRLFVVDGVFAADISDLADLDAGLSISSMADALAKGDALVAAKLGQVVAMEDPVLALNTALMGDGVVVNVAAGAKLATPIEIVCVTTQETGTAVYLRNLVVVEAGAQATLVETFAGPAGTPYQVNTTLDVVIGEGARLDRIKVNKDGNDALHLATLVAKVEGRAAFNDFIFTTGGAVSRNQLFVALAGAETVATLHGASLLSGRQHADTTLVVDHAASHCESREMFRSVLDGSSRDVFQGKIMVRPKAQKTDARMMSRSLLLSEDAEACSKPELEIFADDVQCGHGCTVGSLDDDLKFYLMARGIPLKEAEALLVQAFVGEVIDPIENEAVRASLTEAIQAWLLARG